MLAMLVYHREEVALSKRGSTIIPKTRHNNTEHEASSVHHHESTLRHHSQHEISQDVIYKVATVNLLQTYLHPMLCPNRPTTRLPTPSSVQVCHLGATKISVSPIWWLSCPIQVENYVKLHHLAPGWGENLECMYIYIMYKQYQIIFHVPQFSL